MLYVLSLCVCVLPRADSVGNARAWPVVALSFGCPVLPCRMSPDLVYIDTLLTASREVALTHNFSPVSRAVLGFQNKFAINRFLACFYPCSLPFDLP